LSNSIEIVVIDESQRHRSELLAGQLDLPIRKPAEENGCDFELFFDAGMLKLNQQNAKQLGALWVDFSKGKSAYRQKHQGKGKLPLSRACGIKQNTRPSIIDATAGLGQDAYVLAGLGCKVLCIEQHPVLAALLSDGLSRAETADPWLVDIVGRMELIQGLSETILMKQHAEVVYLDPMYPHQQNRKKAKVKKAMQLFREFPGTSSDEQALLNAALSAATDRVVIKRPDWASVIADSKPSYVVPGKNHRFDVYKT